MTSEAHVNTAVADDSGETTEGENTSTECDNGYRSCRFDYDNHQPVSDDATGPAAIDLVLREIGEKPPENETNGEKPGKTLTFDSPDGPETKEDDYEQTCKDPVYRYKILDTVWLFCNVATMGWVYGIMGPALPDLQIIAGVSLQKATWLFTGFAIGYLGGCLLAGITQDKFNPRLMLFLYTAGTAITIGLLPWIPNFIVMFVIRVINGLCIGGQDTGLHSMLFALWAKDGGPFIQMTHCLSAVGGILSPLVSQPFLHVPEDRRSELPPSYNTNNISELMTKNNFTTTQTMPPLNLAEKELETNVEYAFLITAILTFAASLPFLVAVLQKRRIKKTVRQYSNDSVDRNKLPKKVKMLILIIIFANSFIATANIDLFPSFLATFVIEQISWTQQSASTLTSVFFGTYGVGNFIGVFILNYITATKLIVFSYVTSSVTLLGVLLSVIFKQTAIVWVTVAISGFTMSAILPTLFTWTQGNVTPITGRIASALLISGSAGVMVNPLLLGYMMDVFSPMWFLYLSLGETVVCGMLFATAFSLAKIYRNPVERKTEEIPKEIEDEVSVIDDDVRTPEFDRKNPEIYARGTLYGI